MIGIRPPRISDRFPAEINQETRRLSGVTPKVTRSFQESPAKFLPRVKPLTLKAMAGSRRRVTNA